MKRSRLRKVGLLVLLLTGGAIGLPGRSTGATTKEIIEPFDDGSSVDGVPLDWTLGLNAEGAFQVVDERFIATGNDSSLGNELMGSDVLGFIFGNVSIEATATTNASSGVGVLARRHPQNLTGYGGSLKNGKLEIFRTDGAVRDIPLSVLASQEVALEPEDVRLRLDVQGDQLSLTAWPAGDEMPAKPQITATDNTYTQGTVGIGFQEGFRAPDATGAFDDIHILGDLLGLNLHDDFRHGAGQWTPVDFTGGQAWGPGEFHAADGAYRFQSGGEIPQDEAGVNTFQFAIWDHTSNVDLDDGVVRVRFRIDGEDNVVSLGLRNTGNSTTYSFIAGEHGVGITALTGELDGREVLLDEDGVKPRTGEEWIIEAAAIDDRVAMKLWQAGKPEPNTPQFVALESTPVLCGDNCEVFIGAGINDNFPPDNVTSVDVSFFDVEYRTVDGWMTGDYSINQTLDVADIDALASAIRSGLDDPYFDLNGDGAVDKDDHTVWVKELKGTWLGDANLDGEFNSGDLVAVFTAGEYEDDIALNSGWAEGDWDADGDFTSSDLVAAFTVDGYEQGPLVAVIAVPEPSGVGMASIAILLVAVVHRFRSFVEESRIRFG